LYYFENIKMKTIVTPKDVSRLLLDKNTVWHKYGEVNVVYDDILTLFSYSNHAQMSNRWNAFERMSRGLIINNETGEIVARPFSKFFNLGQNLNLKPTGHLIETTEKMDGSLGILYRKPEGSFAVATRGSFDGEQSQWATEFLNENYDLSELPNEYTLLFEIIYPNNRIVVNYGKREDLVLIGAINRFTGEDLKFYDNDNCLQKFATQFGFSLPRTYRFNSVNDVIEASEKLSFNEEGYVLRFSCGTRLKVKGNNYLNAHRLMTGMNYKRVVEACALGTIDETLAIVPDEFHGEVAQHRDEIRAKVAFIDLSIKNAWDLAPKNGSRKEFALWVKGHYNKLAPYLFAKIDNASDEKIRSIIYKIEF